jgi:gamma-glutamylcysteine synthetase
MTIEVFELELITSGVVRTRTTRVGVEQELLVRDERTGATVGLDRLAAAVADSEYAPYVTFEPGGQLELSLPVDRSATDAAGSLLEAVASVRRAVARDGIELLDDAVDTRAAVPRRLRSSRYDAMERHFDSIGPAGRVMMRRTASTQVCVDWWPGDEGRDQYRALLLSGPWVAAAYARSTGPGSRLATWLEVDPARTAFDGRLLEGDPDEAYARFAAGAARIAEPHLSTLFPPVRPRGNYLEVRYLDAQPLDRLEQAIETVATIAYDPEVRDRVLERLEPLAPRLGDLWRAAAHGRLTSTDLAGFETARSRASRARRLIRASSTSSPHAPASQARRELVRT